MEDKFVRTPSGKFHARVAGDGDQIILIHGYSPDVNSWRTWEKNIDALAQAGRVYALDLLGYGDSDKPDPRLDARLQADSLIELIKVERMTRSSLVGLSWGGIIAQIVVQSIPDMVRKLVLVDSGYDASDKGAARLRKISCPTLIIWDEDDIVIPVEGAHFLARHIAKSQLLILTQNKRDTDADSKNSHWSQMTHSTTWNRAVSDFLVS